MKHKVIILRGIPASGKSTWAKSWVSEKPTERVRFNRDDIRNMLGIYWVPSREPLINSIYDSFLQDAMLSGYDIVIDNMNLNKGAVDDIETKVKEFNEWIRLSPVKNEYEIEYKDFFDTTLEVCIQRDSTRDRPIGENTIRNIYNKYQHIIKGN